MNEYYSWYDLKIYLVDDFAVIRSSDGLDLILDKTSYLKFFIEKIYNLKSEQK